MRIIVEQAEIEEAIEKLILEQIEVPDDMRFDILLKATRGDSGYTAEIDIVSVDAPKDGSDRSIDPRIQPLPGSETLSIAEKVIEAKTRAEAPRRRGRPVGSRNKAKTDATPVAAPVAATPVVEAAPAPALEVAGNITAEVASTEVVAEAPVEAAIVEETPVKSGLQFLPEPEPAAETVEVGSESLSEPITEVAEPEAPIEPEPVVEAPVEAPVAEAVVETPVDAPAELEAENVQPTAVEEGVPEIAPTKSLFANLGRSQNTPA